MWRCYGFCANGKAMARYAMQVEPNVFRDSDSFEIPHEIVIRPAAPVDAGPAVDLIYLPMGELADYLFGAHDSRRAHDVLTQLFVRERNRFSYQFCDVLEADGRLVGMLLSYPARHLKRLALPMGRHLLAIYGWAELLRFIERSRPLMGLTESAPDEYYVYTLAIHPDLQSKGLGRRLLLHGETKARLAGLNKSSLGVTIGNERARKFYERCGYDIVEVVRTPELEQDIRYAGYYRMVKPLASTT
jgi:ribosomal protein S18 acetylase RimI-like enzyme